jgi:hypothetical protein
MPRKPKTDDQQTSNVDPDLMVEALGWYAEKRGDIASIQQEIATGLGRYEKQGIDKDELKYAYKMQQSDLTSPEIVAKLRRREEYLRWANIITVGEDGQTSMAAGLEPKKPSAKAAAKLAHGLIRSVAYNSGRAGGSLDDNPYQAGTEDYVVWAEAFTEGRSDAAQEAEQLPPPSKRAPRKSAPAAAVEALQAQAERLGGDAPAALETVAES